VTPRGLGSRRAIATVAALLSVLVGLSLTASASASVKTFSPVAKTRKALVFKIKGVDPRSIREASVTLRYRCGTLREKSLSMRKVRRAAKRGTLRLRRGPSKAKGGTVEIVVEDPPSDDGAPDTTAPDTAVTEGPPEGSSTTSTSESVTPSGDVYTVPSSVPSGCSDDATNQILSWIASVPDGATLLFGANACYRIEGTLELHDRNLTFDGNGSTFRSLNAPSGQRAMWRAWDSTVTFRDMTIIGSYADGGTITDDLQWAHGIDLRGTHGVVENVSMSDLAGDCVYFGLGDSRSSGAVRDSSCQRIGRNGVSVTAGEDITVERVTTDRIGYVAFDVEPNEGAGYGSSRVVFDSNTIGSYYMKAYTVIGNAPIRDQAFTNNRVVGQGLKIGVVDGVSRPARLTIAGNSSDTPAAPHAMNLDGVDGLAVSGNTVPLTGGTMAQVDSSCGVSVSGNSYPGGSQEASITNPAR
jgi:hypothetical protein